VVPRGKYVLIDFWASWCGMCLHAMPEVAEIAKDFNDIFCVIGVSIDTKDAAWRKAMEKHPEPWPQYITTKQGYQDLFDKYQVGNGVPYYLLVAPDGKVITSPEHPSDVREYLNGIATNKK
jgi:thiol-disulfide isomerase/thioredoxin